MVLFVVCVRGRETEEEEKRGLSRSIHANRHDALRVASTRIFEPISSITCFLALQSGGSDAFVDVVYYKQSSTQHHVALSLVYALPTLKDGK